MRELKRCWLVVGILSVIFVASGEAQEIRRLAPREDTVFVKGDNWVQVADAIHYVARDTFFVLAPDSQFELIYSAKAETFYDSLEARLKRQRLTAQLHDALIRRPRLAPEDRIDRTRDGFLPYEGRIIRRVDFFKVDLYEGSVDDTTRLAESWVGKTLNRLHIDTREGVLRRFVLFDSGEALDADLLADTERLLRSLSYIEDVRLYVRPVAGLPGEVDVVIVTKDRFSIGIDGSASGFHRFRLGIYDNNFLGRGVEMGHRLLYDSRYEAPFGYRGHVHLDNLGDNLLTTDLEYTNSELVNELRVRLDRGFFTPEVKYAGGIDLARTRRFRQQLASDGITVEVPYRADYYDLWAGRSFQLPGRAVRSNFSVALRYVSVAFRERPPVAKNDNFFFHRRNLLLGNLTYIRRKFFRSRNFSGFGDTEDIPTGFALSVSGGFDNGEFRRRPYAGIDFNSGAWLGRAGYLGLQLTASGFLYKQRFEDGLINARALYFSHFLRLGDFRFRQIVGLRYTQGIRRSNPGEYLLLKDRIRDYPTDAPRAQSLLVVNLETVLFTPWNFYGFRTALFAFADLGHLVQPHGRFYQRGGLFAGLGVGVRLRNRSLVFQTVEFRLSYLPRVESTTTRWIPDYRSDDPDLFINLRHAKPLVPRFGD